VVQNKKKSREVKFLIRKGLPMRLDSFEDIRRYAIREESNSASLYRMFAQRTTAGTKRMFEELALEEDEHRKFLENIDMNKVRRYILADVPDLKISDYFLDVKYSEDMTPHDALIFAMKSEEMAKKMYLDMQSKVSDEETKKLFAVLAEQESRHKLRLETMYQREFLDKKW
jgi:rubrerythrin